METVKLFQPVTKNDHVWGNAHALVTLVEYSDFECPFCRSAQNALQIAKDELGSDLRIVYRHFPLRQLHPSAQKAAEAAEAAADQGKFWQMHELLFQNQNDLHYENLLQYADHLGLDLRRFREDLITDRFYDRVQDDVRSGMRSGVNGTPTFYINEIRYDGPWEGDFLLEALRQEIDHESYRRAI